MHLSHLHTCCNRYELRAVEAALAAAVRSYEAEVAALETRLLPCLHKLLHKVRSHAPLALACVPRQAWLDAVVMHPSGRAVLSYLPRSPDKSNEVLEPGKVCGCKVVCRLACGSGGLFLLPVFIILLPATLTLCHCCVARGSV